MRYTIRTRHHNTTVTCDDFNVGSDGFVHAKDVNGTVASIPRENCEGIFRDGVGS